MTECIAFSFGLHKDRHARSERQQLLEVNRFANEASVQSCKGEVTIVHIRPCDYSDSLFEVVRRAGSAVRIDCDVVDNIVVQFLVIVVMNVFDREISAGTLDVEEHLIRLAQQVWRDARIELGVPGMERVVDTHRHIPPAWNTQYQLFAHQRRTVSFLKRMESAFPLEVVYNGNLQMTDDWFLDTENETFTRNPSLREASLQGGVCADSLGGGKTASMLYLVASGVAHFKNVAPTDTCYVSRATLILLPLNLVSQWRHELDKFIRPNTLKVFWILQGKDVRHMTMDQLCDCDLVVTTFHFLKNNKTYNELMDHALAGRSRERAVLTSWARRTGRTQPLLEAVTWSRVIVDEIHQTFQNTRDLRVLKLIQSRSFWGVTATPELRTEQAQHLYCFLEREKAHHPNLLAVLINTAVRSHASDIAHCDGNERFRAVHLSAEERLHLIAQNDEHDSEEEADHETNDYSRSLTEHVQQLTFGTRDAHERCTLPHMRVWNNSERLQKIRMLRAKADGYARSIRILERAGEELANEVTRLEQSDDPMAVAQAEATLLAYDSHLNDLSCARTQHEDILYTIRKCEHISNTLTARLQSLRGDSNCQICRQQVARSMFTTCTHVLCSECTQNVPTMSEDDTNMKFCTLCQTFDAVIPLTETQGVGTKMRAIAELITEIGEDEPVLLFVQWKSMLRATKAYLRTLSITVYLLEGTTKHRGDVLRIFQHGGVLLLSLEDSFSGLHLPCVGNVIFAHAIVGDAQQVQRLEAQAIARCKRQGQAREHVNIYSFIVMDSEEWHLWKRTHA